MPPGTYRKPPFQDMIREEYQACKECVGLIDLSSFTKINITVSNIFVERCSILSIRSSRSGILDKFLGFNVNGFRIIFN